MFFSTVCVGLGSSQALIVYGPSTGLCCGSLGVLFAQAEIAPPLIARTNKKPLRDVSSSTTAFLVPDNSLNVDSM